MNKKIILASLLSLAVFSLAVMPAFAQLGVEYGASTGLGQKDIRQTVADIIKVALGLIGIIAVVIMIAGGFVWMTSFGNEEKVSQAKSMILMGIVGLAVILTAYALTTFVIKQLTTATGFTP